MIESLPPGLLLILGALVIPLLPRRWQPGLAVLLPVLGFIQVLMLEPGVSHQLRLFDYELTVVRVDRLSLVFGYIFHLAAFLTAIYALHVKDTVQHVAAMIYVGSAVGAVFAGDLITLFVYWEITAISSVFLVWASRTEAAYRSGMRYLVIQVGSGVLLLAGVILHASATGSIAFGKLIGDDGLLASASPGVLLIFLAFGIKSAFPFLHNWLQDAYPNGTVTGTVFLSAFTTKLAIYALARGFPGTEILVPMGVVMTLFPVFYAVIENDLRKVLAYSLNNQLGYMVVGIGIGTALSLNGTVSHAFAHILYKALLFMTMGAVLHRTGTIKATELGGLYKSMPVTTVCCIIAAASISGFPFFSGFVTKSMVISEVEHLHLTWIFLGLLVASAGVMEHSGIKIPYFAFFGHDSGLRVKEAPWNMLLAMIASAALCVGIGLFPGPLYSILPFSDVDYEPYTAGHVLTSFQLLVFAILAFAVLVRTGIYPPEKAGVNLDFDWTYRKALPALLRRLAAAGGRLGEAFSIVADVLLGRAYRLVYRLHGPTGVFARTWSTGAIAFWAVVGLFGFLILYFLER
ncbi:MAG TPA: Na(+)/H(+) antiporter subunit D [Chondromyces sp.]|nr:Na(+)/H(+) antiporter subunit D [Chondromyces sp.]